VCVCVCVRERESTYGNVFLSFLLNITIKINTIPKIIKYI
jgi:hypothetical protein